MENVIKVLMNWAMVWQVCFELPSLPKKYNPPMSVCRLPGHTCNLMILRIVIGLAACTHTWEDQSLQEDFIANQANQI